MLTNDKLQQFRDVFKEAAKGIYDKTGITVSLGNITYSEDHFTVKLTGYENTEDYVYARCWDEYAKAFGLDSIECGSQFQHEGKLYEIIGLNLHAKKYPVVIKLVDSDSKFKVTVGVIKKAFKLYELVEVKPGE